MKKEYLLRGLIATIFAIILLIFLFLGIKYFLKDNCNKSSIETVSSNQDCIKLNPSCKHQSIEITNECNQDFIISDYELNLLNSNVEYSDLSGSIQNIIISISKTNQECNFSNLQLKNPETEKDLIQMQCNNLFIPNNYKTIIETGKSFSINSKEVSIEGSWK